MAFFKFRLPGQRGASESTGGAAPTESVEVLRQRAKHRLIGAAVLVLLGVVGFPLLFDTQPRPIAVNIPIDIPDKNKVAPLTVPPPPTAARPSAAEALGRPATPVVTPARSASVTPASSLGDREQLVGDDPEQKVPVASTKSTQSAPKKEADKPAPPKKDPPKKEADRPATSASSRAAEPRARSVDDGSKAQALLDGRESAARAAAAESARAKASDAAGDRFIVQIGAFAENTKAREARLKVEAAGLKTYTHVADTKDGKRIRVRVGPYDSRAEAEKAAKRIKGLGLPAAILTL